MKSFLAALPSLQEIEACAPEKLEEEIRLLLSDKKRHGTTSLIGFFDVASGCMEVPYWNPTRTEEDFVKAVEALVSTDPGAYWTFLCDGLNTHKSDSLMRFVSETRSIDLELGEKEGAAF